ncbi:MAG: hypothetical protein KIT08_01400 [Anaerolineales bacterium]|nr:MAG: hypothetical protein KIT08_01400 [Anaerolineales bacterium]
MEEREERLDTLKRAINRFPGKTAYELNRLLCWPRQTAQNILLFAEEVGVLFWEDDRGGLYAVE